MDILWSGEILGLLSKILHMPVIPGHCNNLALINMWMKYEIVEVYTYREKIETSKKIT